MNVAIGSDHAGFEDPPPHFKPAILEHLQAAGHTVVDCGPDNGDAVDYPDFAKKVVDAILEGRADIGVLVCGTGIGVSIAANRFKGIRAALCCTEDMAELARTHNKANIICLGRRGNTIEHALKLVDTFLATEFSGVERHARRVEKMG